MAETSEDIPLYPAEMLIAGAIEHYPPDTQQLVRAHSTELREAIAADRLEVAEVGPVDAVDTAPPPAKVYTGEIIGTPKNPGDDGKLGPDLSLAADASPQSKRLLPSGVYAKRQKAFRVAEITEPQIETYLTELATTGLKELSAQRAGLSARVINRIKQADHEFKLLCEEAMAMYVDDVVGELHRRAVAGWDEPVFSQKTGTQIGVIRKYDGKLLELLVKRHDPAFREKFEGEVKVTGGVLLVPSMPGDPNAWVAAGQAGSATPPPALPAPQNSTTPA